MVPLSPHDSYRGQYAPKSSDSEPPLSIGSCVLLFPVLPCQIVNADVALGDVLKLSAPFDFAPESFRVLGVSPTRDGWMIVKGYVIFGQHHSPPIGKPEIRVIHKRHIVAIEKDH